MHLLLVRDKKILLMKRKAPGEMFGMYATIAGKVDEAESPTAALVRETMEEVGITVTPEDLRLILTLHHNQPEYKGARNDVIEFYFTSDIWAGEPRLMEPDKAANLDFYPLDNLPQPISPWLGHALAVLQKPLPSYLELAHN